MDCFRFCNVFFFFFFPIVKVLTGGQSTSHRHVLSRDGQDKFGGLHEDGSGGGVGGQPTWQKMNVSELELLDRENKKKKKNPTHHHFGFFCFVFAQHSLFVIYSGFFAWKERFLFETWRLSVSTMIVVPSVFTRFALD